MHLNYITKIQLSHVWLALKLNRRLSNTIRLYIRVCIGEKSSNPPIFLGMKIKHLKR